MRVIVAAVLLFADNMFSCQAPPTAPLVAACPGDSVTVQVAATLSPVITWSPACGMQSLIVATDSNGVAVWTVWTNAESQNAIESGVLYGSIPAHGRTFAGPESLRRGVVYRVEVSRLICDQGVFCNLTLAGSTRFQR